MGDEATPTRPDSDAPHVEGGSGEPTGVGEGVGDDTQAGDSHAVVPSSPHARAPFRLSRRLQRAHKLESIKWQAIDAERYGPRVIQLLLQAALGEDQEGNPIGIDRIQLDAAKFVFEQIFGDLPSFADKVLKDDFVRTVFEAAASAVKTAFGDVEGFEKRMDVCAATFAQIIESHGIMDT